MRRVNISTPVSSINIKLLHQCNSVQGYLNVTTVDNYNLECDYILLVIIEGNVINYNLLINTVITFL